MWSIALSRSLSVLSNNFMIYSFVCRNNLIWTLCEILAQILSFKNLQGRELYSLLFLIVCASASIYNSRFSVASFFSKLCVKESFPDKSKAAASHFVTAQFSGELGVAVDWTVLFISLSSRDPIKVIVKE